MKKYIKRIIIFALVVFLGSMALLIAITLFFGYHLKKTQKGATCQVNKKVIQQEEFPENVEFPIKDSSESQKEGVLYQKGDDLILFNPFNGEKNVVLTSNRIVDYSLSSDNERIAYTLKEEGFEGNSDIFLKDLSTKDVVRLTQKNGIASFSPVIFPDNSNVAYVRRSYDESIKEMSDGEIWTIDIDGDIDSSKRILGDDSDPLFKKLEIEKALDANGEWDYPYFCVERDEIYTVKIGIKKISSDSKKISYWSSNHGMECSGLWQWPAFANIDGSKSVLDGTKFKEQNKFELTWDDEIREHTWKLNDIFWLNNGSFIVTNGTFSPLYERSNLYYDKDQNKTWAIFDSTNLENEHDFDSFSINDIKEIGDGKVLIAYELYYVSQSKVDETGGIDYFMKVFDIGEKISSASLSLGEPFLEIRKDNWREIKDIKIIDEERVVWTDNNKPRWTAAGDTKPTLFLYDAQTKQTFKIDDVEI